MSYRSINKNNNNNDDDNDKNVDKIADDSFQ